MAVYFNARAPRSTQSIRSMARDDLGGGGNSQGLRLKPEFVKAGRPDSIKKVLIVDDAGICIRMLSGYIASALPSLKVAAVDPRSGRPFLDMTLELVAAGDIDMIIVDGQMPGISGTAIIQALRANGYQGYVVANTKEPSEQERMLAPGLADFALPDKNIYCLKDFFLL
jgi:CheY-like chemotaxis protein